MSISADTLRTTTAVFLTLVVVAVDAVVAGPLAVDAAEHCAAVHVRLQPAVNELPDANVQPCFVTHALNAGRQGHSLAIVVGSLALNEPPDARNVNSGMQVASVTAQRPMALSCALVAGLPLHVYDEASAPVLSVAPPALVVVVVGVTESVTPPAPVVAAVAVVSPPDVADAPDVQSQGVDADENALVHALADVAMKAASQPAAT